MYSYEERLSNFDKARGIIGHECVNELLVSMLMCHKETRKNLIDSIHYSIATASCLLK